MRCSIDGCENSVLCRGLCQTHYARLRRNGDPYKLKIRMSPKGAADEAVRRVLQTDTDDCVIWPLARSANGYARIGGKPAYRHICALAHGNPPSPIHQAAHTCGKGHLGCVNPQHLRWKTPRENQADRLVHGTALRGEAIRNAKLTEQDVRNIRRLYAEGRATQSELSKRFGIAQGAISSVITRRTWAHVE